MIDINQENNTVGAHREISLWLKCEKDIILHPESDENCFMAVSNH